MGVDGKTSGYHIFFEPSGATLTEFSNCIDDLAEKSGSVTFNPHVTLLETITATNESQLIESIRELVRDVEPFTVTLGELGMEDYYFRALYLKVNENEMLHFLHDFWTLKIPHASDTRAYMPHLSLYYGDLSQSDKEKLVKDVVLPSERGFLIDRVHLYNTEGEVSEWKKVGEFSFGKLS